jgi:hypothetical protein
MMFYFKSKILALGLKNRGIVDKEIITHYRSKSPNIH